MMEYDKTITYGITGFLIGGMIGLFFSGAIYCLTCEWTVANSKAGSETLVTTLILGGIGMLIGIFSGYGADKEHQEWKVAEQLRKEREEYNAKFQAWAQPLYNQFVNVQKEIKKGNTGRLTPVCEYAYKGWYQSAKQQDDVAYKNYFNEQLAAHKKWLRNNIKQNILAGVSRYQLYCIIQMLQCLRYLDANDEYYTSGIDSLLKYQKDLQTSWFPYLEIEPQIYGNFVNPLDDLAESNYLERHADRIGEDLCSKYQLMQAELNGEKGYNQVGLFFESMNRRELSRLLWYYASKKQFDVNNFDIICVLYNMYNMRYNTLEKLISNSDVVKRLGKENTEFSVYSVEMVLARIYAKVQMGGGKLVDQEFKDYTLIWEEVILDKKDEKIARIFSGGLAWMELYQYELDFLRKCVLHKLALDEEMQERLRFLESGEIDDVSLYLAENTDYYWFDASSFEWEPKKFEMLFRKASMKKKTVSYALTLESWMKAIPLQAGKKVDMDKLESHLQVLMDDYDGEITIERVDAKAVNLENMQYKNAFLFRMTGDRNKYGNMLFHLDKYGRNLNVTIFSLFDPVGVENEMLLKSVQALKSNIYMNSFREAVLQCLDEALKGDMDVFGE